MAYADEFAMILDADALFELVQDGNEYLKRVEVYYEKVKCMI